MKVLMLNPPAKEAQSRDGRCQTSANAWIDVFPPTTFASIAGNIRSNIKPLDLKFMDCIGSNIGFEETIAQGLDFLPDFIILNTSTPTIESDLDVAWEICFECEECSIIAYGENVTARYKELLAKNRIHYAILGEPETPILKILQGTPKVGGVAYRGWDGGLWMEPDLDALPFPAYDLLPPYYYPLTGERWMFVRTGRGCPHKCIYCVEPTISPKPRFHSVDYLMLQFKWLLSLNINLFMFWDEVSTLDKEHMKKLCQELIVSGLNDKIKWFCTTRVDRFDSELADIMYKAGCRLMTFGFESGNQDILNKNQKGITLEQSRKAVVAAKKYGIKTIGHFIIGLPGETPETAKQTAKFACNLGVNFAQFYIATPFPGSQFYQMAVDNKWFTTDDMAQINQGMAAVSYPQFTNKQIQSARRNAYLRFYLRPYAVYSLFMMMSFSNILRLPLQVFNFSKWALK